MKSKNIPSTKAIACFIKRYSPEQSKCIDADFVKLNSMSILAWVIEAPVSKEQGYYQALCSKIIDGKFSFPESSVPCRYHKIDGKKVLTSSPFVQNSEKKTSLISICDPKEPESRVLITLSCKGKPFSQIFVKEKE